MSCCGQKRQAWREYTEAKEAPTPPPPPVIQNPTTIYYAGDSSLVVKGAVSGHFYLFSGEKEGLSVDERDIPELLKTEGFYS